MATGDEEFWKKGYIRLASAKDRDDVCAVLVRNGYTPRYVRKRLNGAKNYSYFVEYKYLPIDLTDEEVMMQEASMT